MVLLALSSCGWLQPSLPDLPEVRALQARHPDAGWSLVGEVVDAGGVQVRPAAELVCTSCPATCVPLSLGPLVRRGRAWAPLDTPVAKDSAAVAAQPMTGEVSLGRTLQVDQAPVTVPWPEGWKVVVARDGAPVEAAQVGSWLVLDTPGTWTLDGGGPPVGAMVVDQEHVVLTSESLGLDWPPGPALVRVKSPPGVSMSTPTRSRWDGGEVIAAYHHVDVRSASRARWVGSAGQAGAEEWLGGVGDQVAPWPGLPRGPWTAYAWGRSETAAFDKGLLVPASGAVDPSAWTDRWLLGTEPSARLGHGWVDDGLLWAVRAWARGDAPAEAGCFGVGSVPPAVGAAAGAEVLRQLAVRVGGDEALRAVLAQAEPATWAGLGRVLGEEDAGWVERQLVVGE